MEPRQLEKWVIHEVLRKEDSSHWVTVSYCVHRARNGLQMSKEPMRRKTLPALVQSTQVKGFEPQLVFK